MTLVHSPSGNSGQCDESLGEIGRKRVNGGLNEIRCSPGILSLQVANGCGRQRQRGIPIHVRVPARRRLIASTAFSGAGFLSDVVFDCPQIGTEGRLNVLVPSSHSLEFLIDLVCTRSLECSRLLRVWCGPLRAFPRVSRLNPRTGWSQILGITLLCTMFWRLRVTRGGTLVLSGVRGLPWRNDLTADVRESIGRHRE
ncbi:hypothetical protein B0H16DRAFT_1553335 [Mycena metata]|uniref:Uncharacterized protein n=1 Tax=Mycena metata TaxID=1033252 RepID=A0AAD7ISY7_9AGAR|nr:hypothetical protein B0H16DRAFT_1553335 [Mycena metata]